LEFCIKKEKGLILTENVYFGIQRSNVMGEAAGCLVWIILIVCMLFAGESWAETLAWITGILVIIAFFLGGGKSGGKYGNNDQN